MSNLNPEQLVQGQLESYNSQDVDAFLHYFADDVRLANYGGDVFLEGIDALKAKHVDLFATFPKNRAELLSRMVIGDTVIDHESVVRGNGGDTFEVGCIYSVKNGRIARVDYIKAGQS